MNIAVTSTVRPLTNADVPYVAGLFARIFLKSTAEPSAELIGYLTSLYLDAPWHDAEIPSLVHQRSDGVITGFIGVIPVPLKWRDRQLRAAVCTALMVEAHGTDPMAGARLLRSVLAGPQDLSICETASDTTMGMWRRLGGVMLPAHSFSYTRVLRPAGALADLLRQRSRLATPLAFIAKPLDRLAHRLGRGRDVHWWSFDSEPDARLIDEDIDPPDLAPYLSGFMADYAIRPAWSETSLARVLAEIGNKPGLGATTARIVRSKAGQTVGAFIYHGVRGRSAHVAQLFATRQHAGAVLDRLFLRAADAGMVTVSGRVEPHLMDALLGRKMILTHNASAGVHSRDPKITQAFERGEAFCNGIAGETWSRLIGDQF